LNQSELFDRALAPLKGALGWSVVFSLSINLLMLTVPLYLLQIFDRVLTSRSLDTLWVLTAIAIVALATLGLLEGLRRLLLGRVGALLDRQLGAEVLHTLLRKPVEESEPISARPLRELTTLRNYLAGNALIPLLDAPWSIIFIVVVFLLHPVLGWLALGSFVGLFLVALLNEKMTRDAIQQAADQTAASNIMAEAAIGNSEAILAMGMSSSLTNRWERHHSAALDRWEQGGRRQSTLTATSKVLRLMLQVAVLGVGATLVIGGELTAGGMIAASILLTRALAPVEQLIASWGGTLAARTAYKTVTEVLAESALHSSSTELPAPSGRLRVEGMSYVHPDQQEPILKTLNFQIQAGESLGLIGPTGSGKTTLARLLLGVLKPRLGNIRLDGMNISEWDENDRGKYIGYLPQDTELFAGTVAENIARFTDASSEDIVAAAQLSSAHDMILQLPRGYDTEIGPRGHALSGGQRQRIALARALFGPIKLVVLDEPNANQDRAGENALLHSLLRLKEQKITSIIIAHRPAIIEHVDKVLVIKDGRMAAFGPKDKVLAELAATPA